MSFAPLAVALVFSVGCATGCDTGSAPPTVRPRATASSAEVPPRARDAGGGGSTAMDARTNDAHGEFSIAIGETVELPDGSKLRLDAHRHKDVTPAMGSSPLIVEGAFARAGEPLESFVAYVQLVRSRGDLVVQGERFEVLAHVYGASMRLRHLGRP